MVLEHSDLRVFKSKVKVKRKSKMKEVKMKVKMKVAHKFWKFEGNQLHWIIKTRVYSEIRKVILWNLLQLRILVTKSPTIYI